MINEQKLREDFERWTKDNLCLDKDENGEFTDEYTFAAWKWFEIGFKVCHFDFNNSVVELEGKSLDGKIDKQR